MPDWQLAYHQNNMNADIDHHLSTGAQPSIVEHFSIENLYGYRSIGLSSAYAATVLIAKNGSGKTTLLGALDAFLKGQFGRLSTLKFETITCKLRGLDDPLILRSEDILASQAALSDPFFIDHAARIGLEPILLLDFFDYDYRLLKNAKSLEDNEVYEKIVSKFRWSRVEANKVCESIYSSLRGRNANIDRIRDALDEVVGDMEIVYLPTYRRIELPLSSESDEPYSKKKSIQSRLGISKRGLLNADIRFGLSDISERLSALNQSILFDSNEGYRTISANIINELISGAIENEDLSLEQRPSKDALELFFSRIRDGRRRMHMGPFRDVVIPDIDKIYSGEDIPQQSNKFLTYFLSKLNTVIAATRDIELMVEEFITNCNRYLSSEDKTTVAPTNQGAEKTCFPPDDSKVLKLDRRNLQVSVESIAARKKVPLESLSSGEKQMISLFARLYLFPGKKVVLIDEPELSLSIYWQRQILMDVVSAPSCAQVVAITHSPFVFDNALEPFAKALSSSFNYQMEEASTNEDEDDTNA
ncbi:AAA family ATPase [Paraburkholderia sp. IW21]|uniref:AAA family ATPase n=1 Tax=Paraburkholderia sp. IW21 TaxID=3242488 RepID=UPI0035208BE0